MRRDGGDDGQFDRRTVLRGAGALALGGGAITIQLSDGAAAQQSGGGSGGFVVEQGGTCESIQPLSGDQSVVDFYGYIQNSNKPNSQQSNTGLEKAGTSRLFLYRGPQGLSLVMLQGGGPREQGGSASFLVSGFPTSGEWAVLDDSFQGTPDRFVVNDRDALLDWTWGSRSGPRRRNDGAAFRGLGEEFCVGIQPGFADRANLDPLNTGDITSLEVLTGSLNNPRAISLDLTEPLTIRTGSCGGQPESDQCLIDTVSFQDPIQGEVTFTCTGAAVDIPQYESVTFEFVQGPTEEFTGPFQGYRTFLVEDDDDGNAADDIVQSIVVNTGEERVRVPNPNVNRCRSAIEGDKPDRGTIGGDEVGDGGSANNGTANGTATGNGTGTGTGNGSGNGGSGGSSGDNGGSSDDGFF